MKKKQISGDLEDLPRKTIRTIQLSLFLLVLNAAMLFSTVTYSQNTNSQKTITGVVTDADGAPLIGVAVLVKGSTSGTVTNLDGDFSITVPSNTESLQFSYIGYQPQEVAIGSQSILNITMVDAAVGLNEVVVTALGISREKESLGYSVGTVGGDELNRTPQASVLSSMQGKIAGVQISQTYGVKGSSMNMVIRGASSLNSDNQPLFVIDGVPVYNTTDNLFNQADLGNAISDINPEDIERLRGGFQFIIYC